MQLYIIVVQDVRSSVRTSIAANIIVSAVGFVQEPRYPADLKGIPVFKGDLFHSARWRHDVDMRRQRVGVIGNGTSAYEITLMPFRPPPNYHSTALNSYQYYLKTLLWS